MGETDFFHVGVDTEPDDNDPKIDFPVNPQNGDFPVNPQYGDFPVSSLGDYPSENLRRSRQANSGMYQGSTSQVNKHSNF